VAASMKSRAEAAAYCGDLTVSAVVGLLPPHPMVKYYLELIECIADCSCDIEVVASVCWCWRQPFSRLILDLSRLWGEISCLELNGYLFFE
jgi:hypothetical protein